MKKAQLSFEFIVLFAVLLFIFIAVAGIFPSSLDKTASTRSIAETIGKDIKAKAITASLSKVDFETIISIPESIGSTKIAIGVYAEPDNIVVIMDKLDGAQLARAFLPRIDSVNELEPDDHNPVEKLVIRKNIATNNLTIDIARKH